MKTMNHIPFLKTTLVLFATITTTLLAENKETITHSFLGVGKANQVVIVGEDGKIVTSSYSSGPLGRFDAIDVVKIITFYESRK